MGKKVEAPPGMQQWIRGVDETLNAHKVLLDQYGRAINSPVKLPTSAANDDDTLLATTTGISSGWVRLSTPHGPDVQVYCDTGMLQITIGAYVTGIRTGAISAYAGAGIGFSLEDNLDGTAVIADEIIKAARTSFSWAPTSPSFNQISNIEKTTVLKVPKGTYKIFSEYFYNQTTTGVVVNWQQRQIVAQSI